MGSKHKTKDKKRKRDESAVRSSADESEEERKSDKPKKRRKKDKKDETSEKKLLKEAKKFLKQKLKEGGKEKGEEDGLSDPLAQVDPITADSYFEKNAVFTAWLRDEKGIFFNDLPSSEARQLFEDFVAAWNGRKLKKKYYAGMTPAEARRTQHKWGIQAGGGVDAAKLGIAAAMEEERELRANQREAEQFEQRQWKSDQKLLMNEMLPKATGREAQVEKRIARREDARARDASPDIAHVPGGGDMYGDGDDFAAARAREAQQGAWKARQQAIKGEVSQARLREAQAKEDDRMAQFRALAARGPIMIAKRQT